MSFCGLYFSFSLLPHLVAGFVNPLDDVDYFQTFQHIGADAAVLLQRIHHILYHIVVVLSRAPVRAVIVRRVAGASSGMV